MKSGRAWSHHCPWAKRPGASHLTLWASVSKFITYEPIDYSSRLHLPIGAEDMEERSSHAWHHAGHRGGTFLKVQLQGLDQKGCAGRSRQPTTDPSGGPQDTRTPLMSVPFQGELGLPGAPGIDGEKVSEPFISLVMLVPGVVWCVCV